MECQPKKYYHEDVGFNYRMTNMQAAIGLAQLEKYKKIIKKKINIAKQYKKNLMNKDNIRFQEDEKNSLNSYWAIALLIKKDFSFKSLEVKFNNAGIEIRNFFYPLNKQKIYKKFAKKKNYVTDNFYKKGILLPTYPSLNNSNIKYICDNLKKFIN